MFFFAFYWEQESITKGINATWHLYTNCILRHLNLALFKVIYVICYQTDRNCHLTSERSQHVMP